MKTKNKSRLMLFIIFLSCFLMVFPSNIVSATSYTIDYGFENGIAGTQVSLSQSGFFTSTRRSGAFNVTTTDHRSGAKMFYASLGSGWWNSSYSKTSYLTNFSGYLKTPAYSGGNITMFFYNSTYQTANITYTVSTLWKNKQSKYMVVLDMFSYGDNYMRYFDELGGAIVINSHVVSGFNIFWFKITDNLGTMKYHYRGTTVDGIACNPTAINNGWRIDRMFIFNSNSANYWYVDDMNFTVSTSYTTSTPSPGCIDLTSYSQIGHFAYTTYTYNYPYIIKKYFVPVTTTIKAVLLECNLAQLSDDGDLGNYNLYINGLDLGNPICDYTNGDELIFEWSCTVALTNEAPVFTFYHSQHTSANQYWKVGTSTYAGADDLDSDGDTTYYLGSSSFTPSSEYPGTYSASSYGDLGLMWFCTGFTTTTNYEYGDSLGLSYWNYQNATGYVYDINNPKGISCSYTLSTVSKAYNCRIELWVNGTQTNSYDFPQYINYPSGSVGMSPMTKGKYLFKLYSYHYLKNVTAWVTGTTGNFKLWVNPLTSNQFSTYTVTAKYYHPQGLNGALGIFDNVLDVNDYSKAIHTYPITSNTTSNASYNSNSSTSEYWQLFAYSTNGYTSVGSYAVHYVRLPFIFENTITPLKSLVILGDKEYLDVKHTFPGCEVTVYVNDIKLADVGGSQVIRLEYTPTKTGVYNATLRINQNGTNTLLNYTSFMVTTATGESPESDTGIGNIVSLIPVEYRLYIAIGIIIGLTLSPTIIVLSYAKKKDVQITVPALPLTIVSVIMGIIGYTLDIIWGLLEWWTVFFLIFVLIMIFAILWIYNK